MNGKKLHINLRTQFRNMCVDVPSHLVKGPHVKLLTHLTYLTSTRCDVTWPTNQPQGNRCRFRSFSFTVTLMTAQCEFNASECDTVRQML